MKRYEYYKDLAGDWRWRLKSTNGRTLSSGQGFSDRRGVLRAISTHRITAATVNVFLVRQVTKCSAPKTAHPIEGAQP